VGAGEKGVRGCLSVLGVGDLLVIGMRRKIRKSISLLKIIMQMKGDCFPHRKRECLGTCSEEKSPPLISEAPEFAPGSFTH
jgi:hypothetical protein